MCTPSRWPSAAAPFLGGLFLFAPARTIGAASIRGACLSNVGLWTEIYCPFSAVQCFSAATLLCMVATLTHVPTLASVVQLFRARRESLSPGGGSIATIWGAGGTGLTAPWCGARAIHPPGEGDGANRIMTCFP